MSGLNLLALIDAIGVFAFALSGLIEARKCDMDLVGLFVVALVTAFGGGTLRDLLLDRHPIFWIEHDLYAIAILVLALVFAFVPAAGRIPSSVLLFADALGLGLFSVAGVAYALEAKTTLFIAALMGVITGTFGGVLRDVLCNKLPALFRQTPLYATCAFAGSYLYAGLLHAGAANEIAVWAAIVAIAGLRLAALRWHWVLPVSRQ